MTTDFASHSLFNVRGLAAVITGGGTGLGLYAAQALAQNGADVYISGRRGDVLRKAANQFDKTKKEGMGKLLPCPGKTSRL